MYATEDRSPVDTRKAIDLVQEIELRQHEAERSSPEKLLRWAADRFGSRLAVSSSFGVEAVVLIDIASRAIKNLRVFTLDTDFLFTETHQLMEQVQSKYGIRVERVRPLLSPEAQAAQFGEALWKRDPNLCCRIRKIDPLKAKSAELDAWVTGIRRDQTSARANAKKSNGTLTLVWSK
jgi:phosphoadenosine phosphosulfate reductase